MDFLSCLCSFVNERKIKHFTDLSQLVCAATRVANVNNDLEANTS